jgi:hypothetical protein
MSFLWNVSQSGVYRVAIQPTAFGILCAVFNVARARACVIPCLYDAVSCDRRRAFENALLVASECLLRSFACCCIENNCTMDTTVFTCPRQPRWEPAGKFK